MLGRCENIMDFFVSHESFRFASLGPVAIEDVDSVAGFGTWSFTVTLTSIFIYNNIYSYPVYEFEFHTRFILNPAMDTEKSFRTLPWLLPRFIARYRLIIDKDESRRNGCSGQMCPLITSCTSPLR